MANLRLQSARSLIRAQAQAMQTAASQALDFSVGSIPRALIEASTGLALALQYRLLIVLRLTSASTSQGADLDTWCADWGFTRLPAVYATGSVTFSRTATTQAAYVPSGAVVRTADGTQSYFVSADATNAAWSASAGASPGYVLAAGVASVTVPIAALAPGTQANVGAGTITLPVSAIPGVDFVTNATALTNGVDAEGDAAFRARFKLFIAGLSKGTVAAVASAVAGVQQGLTWQIVETPGSFTVYVDDGTGSPASVLIAVVAAAVQTVRAAGVSAFVVGPTDLAANIGVIVSLLPGGNAAATEAAISTALTAYVNGVQMGAPLPYLRLAQIVYDAAPAAIAGISSLTLNGAAADLPGVVGQVIRLGTLAVSAS